MSGNTLDNCPLIQSSADVVIAGTNDITLNGNLSTGTVNVNAYNGILINSQTRTSTTTLDGFNIITTDISTIPPYNVTYSNTPFEANYTRTDTVSGDYTNLNLRPNLIEIYGESNVGTDYTSTQIRGDYFNYEYGGTTPSAFYKFNVTNVEKFRLTTTGITMGSNGTGTKINASNFFYSSAYNTVSATLGAINGTTIQTFNGVALTATLPTVTATNVGVQYVITNTDAGNLTVSSFGGVQLIYSSTAPASATTRTLSTGHSRIFTGIRTTSATTYGWSMV